MNFDNHILVEWTRDMNGYKAGADQLLPDTLAMSLIAEGLAKNPRDRFGNPFRSPDPDLIRTTAMEPQAPRRRPYLTKGA